MATYTATRAASTFPVFHPVGQGVVSFAYGVYEIASALSKDDIVSYCKLPICYVIDGFLRSDDIDTGTEALEIDVGVSGDTDKFLDSGVITGDAITDHLPAYATAANVMLHFNGLKDGPISITAASTVIGTWTAAAAAGGTGTTYVGLYFIEVPG